MIDVYVPEGTFPKENTGEVLRQLAECFLRWTDASEIQGLIVEAYANLVRQSHGSMVCFISHRCSGSIPGFRPCSKN